MLKRRTIDLTLPLVLGLTLAFFVAVLAVSPALADLGWVGEMFPLGGATHAINRGMPFSIYAQVYKAGVTDSGGQGAGIECELRWTEVAAFGDTWGAYTATVMSYNADVGNNDEYLATITPGGPGHYEFTAVCSDDGFATEMAQGAGHGRLLVLTSTTAVRLFEWRWADIAQECETWLGPHGFGAVLVSPPMEHAVVEVANGYPLDYPWWQRYQPVSYTLASRSGDRAAFTNMVTRCQAVGVDIYADAVINHMADIPGVGSGGTAYTRMNYGSLYDSDDFHDECVINDYDDQVEVRTCQLSGLPDLKTEDATVQAKIAAYLNDLVGLGVRGFRIDAAKHITPTNISDILALLDDEVYIFGEVISDSGTSDGEYQGQGDVTEFQYGQNLAEKFRAGDLAAFYANGGDTLFAFDWTDFLPSEKALIFSDNHDNQRGHGGGGAVLTHQEGDLYLLGNVFMLAWPYGYPVLMSSYTMQDESIPDYDGIGPPADRAGTTTPVYENGAPQCADYDAPQAEQWICEHRQPPIANMVGFRNAAAGANEIAHWWDNGGDQIAFARHDGAASRGFLALNVSSDATLAGAFATGMPQGVYCNVIDGALDAGGDVCTGSYVVVDAGGNAALSVAPMDAAAIHAAAQVSGTPSLTDLGVSLAHAPSPPVWGETLTTTVVVTNSGADVTGARLADVPPDDLLGATWACTAANGACSANSGSGPISATFDLDDGGRITYTITGDVAADAWTLIHRAAITAPTTVVDRDPRNDASQITAAPAITSDPTTVTLAGSFQSAISGCSDWTANCAATHLTHVGDGVWRGAFSIPAGNWEYKVALNDGWTESHPTNNVNLNLGSEATVYFYFNDNDDWVWDSVNDQRVTPVVVGNLQKDLGCADDWDTACFRTLMSGPDGDNVYTFWTNDLAPGNYEYKVARDEGSAWYPSGDDLTFQVNWQGDPVRFFYDADDHSVWMEQSARRAFWVEEGVLAWNASDPAIDSYKLIYDADGAIELGYDAGGTRTVSPTTPSAVDLSANGTLTGGDYAKFPNLDGYTRLEIGSGDLSEIPAILKGQMFVAACNSSDDFLEATGVQIQGVLDDRYATMATLGLTYTAGAPELALWAPTAKSVTLHRTTTPTATTSTTDALAFDANTGVWSITGAASWDRDFYLYEVEVYAPETGQVERNFVTDPYAVSLSLNPFEDGRIANTQRAQFVDLAGDATLQPAGWDTLVKPPLDAPEDASIYELHVRDFSIADTTVPAAQRGAFAAFTDPDTAGMQYLLALADAGLTHLHILPANDIGSIVESAAQREETPDLSAYPAASMRQQQEVAEVRSSDGFNWGYDPQHYGLPEGAYSTDPDGPQRILEFRQMVQALNQNGLRLVLDVVYNHTYRGGQESGSVLDRVVPGYYHRYDDDGNLYNTSCCADTAAEFEMMEKLMVDTITRWATAYKVDGFRFDLMNLHTVSNVEAVRDAVRALTTTTDGVDGGSILLYGEGWDFGSAQSKGLNYAKQWNVAGTGVGTFNDKIRDAAHGGYSTDDLAIRRQGFINGLSFDWNGYEYASRDQAALFYEQDRLRVTLAGSLREFTFTDRFDNPSQTGQGLDGTGYAFDPQESVNYVSKHDNETLYDQNIFKAPESVSMAERVRMQNMGLSLVGLAQGMPFFQAGSDMLRSKSLDRNSYDSGDHFNALDFSYQANNFGQGLPPAWDNESRWDIMAPLLRDPALVATRTHILSNTHHLRELLRIRYSSPLFRLQTTSEITARVAFHNTGSGQTPGLLVMTIDDTTGADLDPAYERVIILFNADKSAHSVTLGALSGLNITLHPVHAAAYDPVVRTASYISATGAFSVPARTTAVFVQDEADVLASEQSGAWDDPDVWGGSLPSPSDDVTVTTGATVTLGVSAQVNTLMVEAGGTLGWRGDGATLLASGPVTNLGTLSQTVDGLSQGEGVALVAVQDAGGGAPRYRGVVITPTAGALGQTTVRIRGGQACTTQGEPGDTVDRCFDIATDDVASTVRFYYLASEAQGDPGMMKVWHWTGSAWEEAGASQQTGGDGQPYYWVEVTDVDSFSPFVLKSGVAAPTALAGRHLTAQSSGLIWSLASLLLLVGWVYLRQQR